MPPVGAKKVKTTKELLEQIQSRSQPVADLAAPDSPDVMLIEPDGEVCPIKVESPLRNGRKSPRAGSPPAAPAPAPAPTPAPAPPPPPLEDEREYAECTCGAEAAAQCPAAAAGGEGRRVRPLHVRALHCAYLPGVNGTRAPPQPHRYAVRPLADPDPARAGLYSSVVPLYKYSDYADDRCAKNMARVPLCRALPWTQFAPAPPDPPPPPQPPEPRPYPLDEPPAPEPDLADDDDAEPAEPAEPAPAPEAEEPGPDESEEPRPVDAEELRPIEAEAIGIPSLEPSERLKAPLLLAEDEPGAGGPAGARDAAEAPAEAQFATDIQDHRTVERTKAEPLDGRGLYRLCCDTIAAVPYDYEQLSTAPVLTLPAEEPAALAALEAALERAREATTRDALGRPARPDNFAEWHECVRLGELVALPYVVID